MKTALVMRRGSVVGKDIYVGIDVHKESWQITVRTEGEEIFNGRIPGQYQSLKKFLERYQGCRMKVAYEAGPFGFWLSDKLTMDGIEVLVVPPSLIPTESSNRVKTDRRDSKKLARLLESNMLKSVYVLTPEEREHRDLLRTRRQIVDHRNDVARQIKSKLLFYGITPPFTSATRWSFKYIKWLKALPLDTAYLKECFDLLIDLYEYLTRQIMRINKKVALLCRDKKYRDRIRLLCTAPGIGRLTAIEILVELKGHVEVRKRRRTRLLHRPHPLRVFYRGTDAPGEDHPVRQQEGANLPRGEHLDTHREGSRDAAEVPQAEEPQGREAGDHRHREKAPPRHQAHAPR